MTTREEIEKACANIFLNYLRLSEKQISPDEFRIAIDLFRGGFMSGLEYALNLPEVRELRECAEDLSVCTSYEVTFDKSVAAAEAFDKLLKEIGDQQGED